MTLTLRELKPKDFYFLSLLENDFPDMTASHKVTLIFMRIGGLTEEDLLQIPSKQFGALLEWMVPNLLEDRMMKLDQWLEVGFHLCKQRWDSSLEWLEEQPMPKILLMSKILTDHAEKQNREMKR